MSDQFTPNDWMCPSCAGQGKVYSLAIPVTEKPELIPCIRCEGTGRIAAQPLPRAALQERIEQLESRIKVAIEQAKASHNLALADVLMSLLEGDT